MSLAPSKADLMKAATNEKRIEAARKAVQAFEQQIRNQWEPLAQVMTKNRRLTVHAHPSSSFTDGRKIMLRVPLELGGDTEHTKHLCGERDDDGAMLCPACYVLDDVVATVAHEVAHVVEGSFTSVDAKTIEKMFDVLLAPRIEAVDPSKVAPVKATVMTSKTAMEVASKCDAWLPMVLNALEDVFVNERMYEARPGFKPSIVGTTIRVIEKGFLQLDGSVREWKDAPKDARAIMVAYAMAAGIDKVIPSLGDDLKEVVHDMDLRRTVGEIHGHATAQERLELSLRTLEILRGHGLCVDDRSLVFTPVKVAPGTPGASEEEGEGEGEEGDDTDSTGSGGDEHDDDAKPSKGSGKASSDEDDEDDEDGDDEGAGKAGESDDDEDDASDDDSDDEGDSGSGSDDDEADDDDDASSSGKGGEDDDEDSDDDAASDDDEDSDDDDAFEGEDDDDDDFSDEDDDDEDFSHDGTDAADKDLGDDSEGDDDSNEGGSSLSHGDDKDVEMEREEAERALKAFMGHAEDEDRPEPSFEEKVETELTKLLMEQQGMFEDLSFNVRNVGLTDLDVFDGRTMDRERAKAPTESDIASVLNELRIIFSGNLHMGVSRNLKQGPRLDTAHLYRLKTGDPRLFAKRSIPKKRSWAVTIGLDCSGSTGYDVSSVIKNGGYAMAELLTRLGIPFSVYGHSGSYSGGYGGPMTLDMFHVKRFEEQWDQAAKDRCLGLHGVMANLDGHTLEFYRRDIEARRETDKLIMYFTDGQMPMENYDEELAFLQRNIVRCQQKGINLVGVGVGTDSPKAHGLDTIRYDNIRQLPNLIRELGKRLTA